MYVVKGLMSVVVTLGNICGGIASILSCFGEDNMGSVGRMGPAILWLMMLLICYFLAW